LNGWQIPDIYCKKCICSQEPIISTEYRTFYFPIASAEFIIQNFLLFSHDLDHPAQAYLERYTHIVVGLTVRSIWYVSQYDVAPAKED
jgi:hypothetical protein